MTPQTVRAAVAEAQRFVTAAEDLLEREAYDVVTHDDEELHRTYPLTGSKASGATRRASLDLTRALAEMRKP